MDARTIDALQSVHATLNYTVDDGQRPFAYTFDPPPGRPQRSGQTDSVPGVRIRNARPLAGLLSLAEEGFELVYHPSAVTDFYDARQVREVYAPEVDQLEGRDRRGEDRDFRPYGPLGSSG